ncbi:MULTISPECIES: hypothetical protein [Acinetobacter]|jgi:hypothetical protein|uniref:Uncharacterized protein n=3 Tax=Acinetobacter TaxID=469 RepID=A0A429KNR3_ACIPI|nr:MULTISPECIES: hypothetical protein [Acinetobacter]AMO40440.1 hypothetical protein A0J50_07120 [Acinetobacter sp. DUT-2]MDR0070606.1 hypothetical protein [Acinetobacter sp. 11520]AMM29853.1 hypothetical protein AYJ52_15885 [Acinetobacter pittii]KQE20938.1 hypothetical protein APD36_02270 [Acinetobacter pittii]KQF43919.1 hypothetical protein APC05_09445 [Acinetobacter pittii]
MSVLIEFVSATVHTKNLRSVGVKAMSLFLLHKKVTSELSNFSVPAMRAFSMRGLAFFISFYDFAVHWVSLTSGKNRFQAATCFVRLIRFSVEHKAKKQRLFENAITQLKSNVI